MCLLQFEIRNSCKNRTYIALIVFILVSKWRSTWSIRFWHTIYRHQPITKYYNRHIINIHYIKPLHWSLWMAHGGHVFCSCKICKQTYIIAQKTCLPSDGGIYWPFNFDVCHSAILNHYGCSTYSVNNFKNL